ncbi:hypothetical protein Leryth_009705, partial [Lithospermum erythrorhizon]
LTFHLIISSCLTLNCPKTLSKNDIFCFVEITISLKNIPFFYSIFPFCSGSSPENSASSDTKNADSSFYEQISSRNASAPPRGNFSRNSEKVEDIICRMMANRDWTTRLQNSIRNLVPKFDNELVYNC